MCFARRGSWESSMCSDPGRIGRWGRTGVSVIACLVGMGIVNIAQGDVKASTAGHSGRVFVELGPPAGRPHGSAILPGVREKLERVLGSDRMYLFLWTDYLWKPGET